MDIRGSRVLVVGGAGFIGSHIVDELTHEDLKEIIVYDNFCRGTMTNLEETQKDPRVRIYEIGGDICQTDILDSAVKGADYVIHLAALWLLQCYEYPRAAFDVNVRGTFNVLEACVTHKVKKLIYSSSASVYGDAIEIPMTEEHPYHNKTFYGATKIAGEQMCRAFYYRYGLNYVGLRYMNVYGPRQDYRGAYIAVIMKILDRLDKGLSPIVYGDGSQAYDFIYVSDCAKANLCALKADTVDSFYNVGRGIQTTIKELTELILEITSSNLKIQYKPEGTTFVKNRVGCPKKAEAEIGFKSQVGLKEGLERLIEWRKNHKGEVMNRRLQARINDD
jgi:UDP-glucose 4-epimerase